jgi:hypothetical protein
MENEGGHQNQQGNNPANRNISATNQSGGGASIISEITENVRYAQDNNRSTNEEDDQGASSQFGATGRSKRHRTLGAITSSVRRIGKALQIGKPDDYSKRARAEIDTRADTVCAGSTFILYESTGKVVDVSGFHDSMGTLK